MSGTHQTPFKQTITIVLLVLFAYNIVFSHVSLWIWKAYMNECLEELASERPDEELDEIILPYSGTIEHEINHDGVMYDVIRYQINANTIRYFCLKDFTENILSSTTDSDLDVKTLSAKKHWNSHSKQLHKNSTLKYLLSYSSLLLFPTPKVHVFAVSIFSIKATLVAISSPPPDDRLI